MKSIKIYEQESESYINFIFLSGRFISWHSSDEKDVSIVWDMDTIKAYMTGWNWPDCSPGNNITINVSVIDEDCKECTRYTFTEMDSLLKDGIKITSKDSTDALEKSIAELVESYRIKWTNPRNRHYFYPHLKIIIHSGETDSYCIKIHPWPTDDDYGFFKLKYFFYTGETSWCKDNPYPSVIWPCSDEDLLSTFRDVLETEEYLGTLPVGLECLIVNEQVPDTGVIEDDVISEVDELSLYDVHDQITDDNFTEKTSELVEKCNTWILDEVEHFIDWFEENPFNIAEELKGHEETDQDYWEDEESIPE